MNYFTACQRIPEIVIAQCHQTAPLSANLTQSARFRVSWRVTHVTPNDRRFMDNLICDKIYRKSKTDHFKIKPS